MPNGWQACDGSIIEEGIWTGQPTPDLTTDKRFLRGGTIEDVLRFVSLHKSMTQNPISLFWFLLLFEKRRTIWLFAFWFLVTGWCNKTNNSFEDDSTAPHDLTFSDRFHYGDPCPAGSYEWRNYPIWNKDADGDRFCERNPVVNGGASETKPRNMNVVFIIKIK